MTTEARYLNYFSSAISQQSGSDKESFAASLLRRIEEKLRADGYEADVISNEMAMARTTAAMAVAGTPAASVAAPEIAASERESRVVPLALLRRVRPLHVLIVILGLLAYTLPLLLFLREARDTDVVLDVAPGQVAMALSIGVADFSKETVTFHILPSAGALIQADGTLSSDLTVEVDPGTGPVSHKFKANTLLAPWTLHAATDSGDILDYPFDRYELELVIQAKAGDADLKVITGLKHVPHGLAAVHRMQSDAAGETIATVQLRRSGTIIFLALLSTLSLLLVSIAACSVAWQVAYRGRKIEFSMMVWVAALLFVIPTVRNALPGGVPPGALIDFLVFFWLQIATVVAMSSLVVTWIRRVGT